MRPSRRIKVLDDLLKSATMENSDKNTQTRSLALIRRMLGTKSFSNIHIYVEEYLEGCKDGSPCSQSSVEQIRKYLSDAKVNDSATSDVYKSGGKRSQRRPGAGRVSSSNTNYDITSRSPSDQIHIKNEREHTHIQFRVRDQIKPKKERSNTDTRQESRLRRDLIVEPVTREKCGVKWEQPSNRTGEIIYQPPKVRENISTEIAHRFERSNHHVVPRESKVTSAQGDSVPLDAYTDRCSEFRKQKNVVPCFSRNKDISADHRVDSRAVSFVRGKGLSDDKRRFMILRGSFVEWKGLSLDCHRNRSVIKMIIRAVAQLVTRQKIDFSESFFSGMRDIITESKMSDQCKDERNSFLLRKYTSFLGDSDSMFESFQSFKKLISHRRRLTKISHFCYRVSYAKLKRTAHHSFFLWLFVSRRGIRVDSHFRLTSFLSWKRISTYRKATPYIRMKKTAFFFHRWILIATWSATRNCSHGETLTNQKLSFEREFSVRVLSDSMRLLRVQGLHQRSVLRVCFYYLRNSFLTALLRKFEISVSQMKIGFHEEIDAKIEEVSFLRERSSLTLEYLSTEVEHHLKIRQLISHNISAVQSSHVEIQSAFELSVYELNIQNFSGSVMFKSVGCLYLLVSFLSSDLTPGSLNPFIVHHIENGIQQYSSSLRTSNQNDYHVSNSLIVTENDVSPKYKECITKSNHLISSLNWIQYRLLLITRFYCAKEIIQDWYYHTNASRISRSSLKNLILFGSRYTVLKTAMILKELGLIRRLENQWCVTRKKGVAIFCFYFASVASHLRREGEMLTRLQFVSNLKWIVKTNRYETPPCESLGMNLDTLSIPFCIAILVGFPLTPSEFSISFMRDISSSLASSISFDQKSELPDRSIDSTEWVPGMLPKAISYPCCGLNMISACFEGIIHSRHKMSSLRLSLFERFWDGIARNKPTGGFSGIRSLKKVLIISKYVILRSAWKSLIAYTRVARETFSRIDLGITKIRLVMLWKGSQFLYTFLMRYVHCSYTMRTEGLQNSFTASYQSMKLDAEKDFKIRMHGVEGILLEIKSKNKLFVVVTFVRCLKEARRSILRSFILLVCIQKNELIELRSRKLRSRLSLITSHLSGEIELGRYQSKEHTRYPQGPLFFFQFERIHCQRTMSLYFTLWVTHSLRMRHISQLTSRLPLPFSLRSPVSDDLNLIFVSWARYVGNDRNHRLRSVGLLFFMASFYRRKVRTFFLMFLSNFRFVLSINKERRVCRTRIATLKIRLFIQSRRSHFFFKIKQFSETKSLKLRFGYRLIRHYMDVRSKKNFLLSIKLHKKIHTKYFEGVRILRGVVRKKLSRVLLCLHMYFTRSQSMYTQRGLMTKISWWRYKNSSHLWMVSIFSDWRHSAQRWAYCKKSGVFNLSLLMNSISRRNLCFHYLLLKETALKYHLRRSVNIGLSKSKERLISVACESISRSMWHFVCTRLSSVVHTFYVRYHCNKASRNIREEGDSLVKSLENRISELHEEVIINRKETELVSKQFMEYQKFSESRGLELSSECQSLEYRVQELSTRLSETEESLNVSHGERISLDNQIAELLKSSENWERNIEGVRRENSRSMAVNEKLAASLKEAIGERTVFALEKSSLAGKVEELTMRLERISTSRSILRTKLEETLKVSSKQRSEISQMRESFSLAEQRLSLQTEQMKYITGQSVPHQGDSMQMASVRENFWGNMLREEEIDFEFEDENQIDHRTSMQNGDRSKVITHLQDQNSRSLSGGQTPRFHDSHFLTSLENSIKEVEDTGIEKESEKWRYSGKDVGGVRVKGELRKSRKTKDYSHIRPNSRRDVRIPKRGS